MSKVILGIDPGMNTGIAVFNGGLLEALHTILPHQIENFIRSCSPGRLVFEDSRLISHIYTTNQKRAVALNMARKVGQVDAWCNLITLICSDLKVPAHGISPLAKGAKLKAPAFARLTGWVERSNEHERDAATVAWKYRSAV